MKGCYKRGRLYVLEESEDKMGGVLVGRLSCGCVWVSPALGALGVDISLRIVGSEFFVVGDIGVV